MYGCTLAGGGSLLELTFHDGSAEDKQYIYYHIITVLFCSQDLESNIALDHSHGSSPSPVTCSGKSQNFFTGLLTYKLSYRLPEELGQKIMLEQLRKIINKEGIIFTCAQLRSDKRGLGSLGKDAVLFLSKPPSFSFSLDLHMVFGRSAAANVTRGSEKVILQPPVAPRHVEGCDYTVAMRNFMIQGSSGQFEMSIITSC
ncbi:hypothetical protein KQX54_005704 [Cotesia glomerata]|uniref:Uncharacterized protein n=1 Tax=Cotesia glomerata TaxID=32391 RepID=A0AAV7ID63_COTGL|nr:hypothetical protein KQX54_005704 [Cotesia glomerata]